MSYDPDRHPRQGQPSPPVVSGPPSYGSYPVQPPQTRRPEEHDLAPNPWPQPQEFQPQRKARWPYLVIAGALLFLAVGAWTAYDRGLILKDSGVKACEALRDGQTTFGNKAQNDQKMTEAGYRELRGVFEDSRHDDIRDHGTKLMDIVWQVSQFSDDEAMGALAYIGPLTTQMTGLQSACADQGIIVTLRPDN